MTWSPNVILFAALPWPLPFPPGAGAVGIAVLIKLSQAATVALGHKVEPAVVPEPVKIGADSSGRIPPGKDEELPPTSDPSAFRVPFLLDPRTNSLMKVTAYAILKMRYIGGKKGKTHSRWLPLGNEVTGILK